jgi:hypothetical protein
MGTTEIKDLLAASSIKVAWVAFISSGILLLVPSSWFSVLGLESYRRDTIDDYDAQIFVVLVVSLILVVFDIGSRFVEWRRNRDRRLRIIKATYGVDKDRSIDVTNRVRALITKGDKLDFKVDDDALLAKGKSNDPMQGSSKVLTIEYLYRGTEKRTQGDSVHIGD